MNIDQAYKKWVSTRKCRNGTYTVKCKKGLWRVDAPSKRKAEAEASHYFAQYFADGEYA